MPSVEKIEKVERIKGTDLADLHSPKSAGIAINGGQNRLRPVIG
jgi:hypothetical protein